MSTGFTPPAESPLTDPTFLAGTPVQGHDHPLGTAGRHAEAQPPGPVASFEAGPSPAADLASEAALAARLANPIQTPSAPIDPAAVKAAVDAAMVNQFAVTEAWKPKDKVRFVINCPSGQACLAEYPDPLDLIEAGIAEEIDYFQRKLFPASLDPSGSPVEYEEEEVTTSALSMLKDVHRRQRFIALMNKLCAQTILKPGIVDDGVEVGNDEKGKPVLVYGSTATEYQRLQLFPNGVPELKEGQVYASSLPFSDKMHIFDELNKPLAVIQPFRESPTGVSDVESSTGVGSATE